jgi:hypothetical protein
MVAEFDRDGPGKSGRRGISRPYNAPAGGWGSVKSLARALTRERVLASAPFTLFRQNKPDGFACVSCAWHRSRNGGFDAYGRSDRSGRI